MIRTDRPGIALLVVMLVTMVVAAIAAGAALIGANSFLINEYDQRTSLLESVADAGLELGRARVNANPGLYSDTAPRLIELDATAYDATGQAIPGVTRTVWILPVGGGSGEFGNFAALVAIARSPDGGAVVRRQDLLQESFATFAYFTDQELAAPTFDNGDRVYGPAHSNADVSIGSGGATFHGDLTTAGALTGAGNGVFLADTASGVGPIRMPTLDQIARLRQRAVPANLAFTTGFAGTYAQSTARILFISRDVDGDGIEEGFIRLYRATDTEWVTGNIARGHPNHRLAFARTPNCGHTHDGYFTATRDDPHSSNAVLHSGSARCYLGGADELNATPSSPDGVFVADDGRGTWRAYPTSTPSVLSGQPDAGYLYPLDRSLNPGFRGVIAVDGDVVVSGTVRGRVTLAATGSIIIGDDLVYATDPGAGTCVDMLGLFAGRQVVVADNTLNAPQSVSGGGSYKSFDDTGDETIHASIVALDQFSAENASTGATAGESCRTAIWGRGCLNLHGGLVQRTRGQVGTSYGTGYIPRYTHDTCVFTTPPPYFPGTGHFTPTRYYEVDPTGFDIRAYFNALN